MTHGLKGKFVIVDGLDGIGKGVVVDTIANYLKTSGKRILNLRKYWEEFHDHPDFENKEFDGKPNKFYIDLDSFDVIISNEPTYAIIGRAIRYEIIAKNGRDYSVHFTAQSYSSDRLILYKRVILPALRAGKIILQERSFSTSIVFQSTQEGEDKMTVDEILALEGNAFCLKNTPDLLIIPTIKDVEDVIKRLDRRAKDDNCEFENLDFQKKIKPLYESKELRKIFEDRGTVVKYLDAGISLEETKKQAIEIYKSIVK
ncbi:MAG: dTMP kinase [archaeon]